MINQIVIMIMDHTTMGIGKTKGLKLRKKYLEKLGL